MCKQTLFQVLYIDFMFMYLSGLQYVYMFIHFMHVMVYNCWNQHLCIINPILSYANRGRDRERFENILKPPKAADHFFPCESSDVTCQGGTLEK